MAIDRCDSCQNEVANGCIEHEVYLCKRHWAEHQKAEHGENPTAARVASDERCPDAPPAAKKRGRPPAAAAVRGGDEDAGAASIAKCLLCERELKIACRGVCSSCLTQIGRAVKAGETTREELVEAGLLAPAKPRGASPIVDALTTKLAAFRAKTAEERK